MKACPACGTQYDHELERCPNDDVELIDVALPRNPVLPRVMTVAPSEQTAMLDLDALAAERARRGFATPDDAPEEVEEYQPLTTADEGAPVDPDLTSSLKRLRRARRVPGTAEVEGPRQEGAAVDESEESLVRRGRGASLAGHELREDVEGRTRASALRSSLRSSLRDSVHDEVTEQTRRPRDSRTGRETSEELGRVRSRSSLVPASRAERARRGWAGAAVVIALGGGAAGYAYVYNSGVLSVTSAPPGATVSIDGEVAGTAPLHQRVRVGSHVVELQLAGYLPFKEVVDVEREGLPFVQPLTPDPEGARPPSIAEDGGPDEERQDGTDAGQPQVDSSSAGVVPEETPEGAEALFARFDEQLAAGRLDAALATLKEAVRVAPSDPRTDALFPRLTAAQSRASKPTGGVPGSIRRSPPEPRRGADAAKVAFAEGEAEVRRQRPAEAREHFLEAIRLDPSYADPHRSVARIFERDGDLSRARYHLERYLRLGGPDHDRRVRRWLEEHR